MIKLRLPLRDILMTQPWGANYVNFYQQMGLSGHPGIDLKAKHGCKLYAAHDGEVINARVYSDGGLGVEIQHKEGWSTFYYHLDRFNVRLGDKVSAGQIIGYCDNTGKYTTGDHLHFELRVNDKKINPAGYFFWTYNGIDIKPKDWSKSRSYHRYYRQAKRNIANEIKTAIYMAKSLKKLPTSEEINMAIWGGWDIEAIKNPAMYEITSQITKDEYLNKGFRPFME